MKVLLPHLQWFTVAYSGDAGSRLVLGKGATASQLLVACCACSFQATPPWPVNKPFYSLNKANASCS
ncbi:hypothetical protein BASA_1582 [Bifidobacterium animalis subsp. animalis]|nr:hypothetical protein BASA_1582 [Bifidobacterium animalis subsp. animalis]